MTNLKQDIQRQIQEWIFAEQKAGRSVDTNRINEYLQDMMRKHNSSPRAEFNGLTPEQMSEMLYNPFGPNCLVQFNHLSEEQYMQIPLVKQTLFLMQTLSEKELKMTQNGWLPLKIVNESYHLGRPIYIIESLGMKRINEYDATSVWMTHLTLDFLGWIKVRKGMLSLTAKGKKALSDVDAAANEIIRWGLVFITLTGMKMTESEIWEWHTVCGCSINSVQNGTQGDSIKNITKRW